MTPPVLFLGLGGTGKDALMHLRRLFLDEYSGGAMPDALRERYGPARLPHTAYLCIDADDKMEDIDGRVFDEFMMRASLSETEFLNVELDPRRVRDLYDHPERHPEHARWFDFGLEKSGVPKNGCGATRPWGRLAFFQHYTRIREQLRNVLSSLIAVDVANDAKQIGITNLSNSSVQVFCVFSVAGGTGSGLFLDTAFLLQDLADELHIKVNAEAMILLPEVFSSDPTNRVFANSYAALTEIEYYNLRRQGAADLDDAAAGTEGVFPVYWPGRTSGGEVKTMRGPVFEPVWLIGNRSRGIDGQGGGTVVRGDHKSELTAMMSEWMFLRTAPRLRAVSADINLRASNYAAQEMLQTAHIPIYEPGAHEPTGAMELSCRYGSFGLAKVFTPVNVTRQMAGDRLIADIVGAWTLETAAAPSDEDLERDLRPKALLRLATQEVQDIRGEDALFDAIDADGAPGGTGIVREATSACRDAFHPSLADQAGDQLATLLRDKFNDFQWASTSTQKTDAGMRGQYAERVRLSAQRVFGRVRDGLDRIIAQALAEPSRRFPYAAAALTRLNLEFADVAVRADGKANDAAGAAGQHLADRDVLLGHAANTRMKFVLRRIAKVALDDQAEMVMRSIEAQVWREVADGARSISALIGSTGKDEQGAVRGSLVSDLAALRRDLLTLKDRLHRRFEGLAARHESILNEQVLAADADVYYRQMFKDASSRDFIRSAELRLLGSPAVFTARAGGTPWALRGRFLGAEGERLLDALSEFGWSETPSGGDQTDVLAVLDQKYSGGAADRAYADAIRQTVQSGTAWLATRSTGREGDWRSVINYTVVRSRRSTLSAERLSNVFKTSFGEARASMIDGPPEAIYFEQELAAFPLSVLPAVKDYRDKAYLPILRKPTAGTEAQGGGAGLHIELNIEKYVDLVEPTREEAARRADAVQLFIEAQLKGRLQPQRDRFGLVHYSYLRRQGVITRPFDLGRYDRAVRALVDRTSREAVTLREQVEEVELKLNALPDKGLPIKARVLAILDRYINDPEHSPVRGAEWERNAQRLSDRLVGRWGPEAFALARAETRTLDQWKAAPLADSLHLTPPDLPALDDV